MNPKALLRNPWVCTVERSRDHIGILRDNLGRRCDPTMMMRWYGSVAGPLPFFPAYPLNPKALLRHLWVCTVGRCPRERRTLRLFSRGVWPHSSLQRPAGVRMGVGRAMLVNSGLPLVLAWCAARMLVNSGLPLVLAWCAAHVQVISGLPLDLAQCAGSTGTLFIPKQNQYCNVEAVGAMTVAKP